MSNSVKAGWPDLSALPFMQSGAQPHASAAPPSLTQGFASGMDLIRKFWGNLPGGTSLPGFLVPTVDVDELDKRISDLRAAESWLEVNVNLLRATIQGLEVQRNTIAALQSLTAMAGSTPGSNPSAGGPGAQGLAPGWPMSASTPEAPPPAPTGASPAPANEAPDEDPSSSAAPTAGVVANNWLGFMQEQFTKVAQAAIAASPGRAASEPATKTPRSVTTRPPAKKAGRRKTPAR